MKVTPERLKALRTKYGTNGKPMSQADFGVRLGYTPSSAGRQVRFFESGDKTVTGQTSLIIRYIERYGFLDD